MTEKNFTLHVDNKFGQSIYTFNIALPDEVQNATTLSTTDDTNSTLPDENSNSTVTDSATELRRSEAIFSIVMVVLILFS